MESKLLFGGVLVSGMLLYFTFVLRANHAKDLVILWCCGAVFLGFFWGLYRYNSAIEKGRVEKMQTLLTAAKKSTGTGAGHYEYTAPSEKNVGGLTVVVPAQSRGNFLVTRRNWLITSLKSLFGARSIQTGDFKTDNVAWIESADSAFAEDVFASAERRRAVIDLLDLGFDTIQLEEREFRASITFSAFNLDRKLRDLRPETLARGFDELRALSRSTADLLPRSRELAQSASKFKVRQDTLAKVELAILILTLGLYFFVARPLEPLDGVALMIRAGVWAIVATFIAAMLSRKFIGGAVLTGELVAIFGVAWLCCFFTFSNVLTISNAWLDQSAIMRHDVIVRDKAALKHGRSIFVDSWRLTGGREQISVPWTIYDQAQSGGLARVFTRKGWLNMEHVVLVEPVELRLPAD